MRLWPIICFFILAITLALPLDQEAYASTDPLAKIEANIPSGWKIKETKEGEIPWGHYWGLEYSGAKGTLILLEGPANVNFRWRDSGGNWHTEPLAKEALELWIMPPGYGDTWKRFFTPHRPVTAKKILSNNKWAIYGHPTHRITSEETFQGLLKQATSTGWPRSPHNEGALSWSTWDKDIRRVFEKE